MNSQSDNGVLMKPTLALRRIVERVNGYIVEQPILQQRWDGSDGSQEWRDIPVVIEDVKR